MILVNNTWDFLLLCAAKAAWDASELLRQKADIFSLSDLLVVAWQSVDPILPYNFQVKFSWNGA